MALMTPTGCLGYSPWHQRMAYLFCLLDIFGMGALMLIIGLHHTDFFKLDFHDSIFDLAVIGIGRGLVLLLLFWQAHQLGTVYRIGRDGHSKCHTVTTRVMLVMVPISSLAYAITKLVLGNLDDFVGNRTAVLVGFAVSITCPVLEVLIAYIAFVRVRYDGPDPEFLEMVKESGQPEEKTPLIRQTSLKKKKPVTLMGLMEESSLKEQFGGRKEQKPKHRPRATKRKRSRKGPRSIEIVSAVPAAAAADGQLPVANGMDRTSGEFESESNRSSLTSNVEIPAPIPIPVETEEEKLLRKRHQVAQEILATEQSYVRTLEMIIDVFLIPLRESAEALRDPENATIDAEYIVVIEKHQVKTIFLSLEMIQQVHRAFLNDMEKKLQEWSPVQQLADSFLNIMSFFKVYISFANNFNNALSTISMCKRQPSFNRFLNDCMNRPECGKMWLDDHLIAPIQRIPRYILLLKELLKKTPEKHPDFEGLTQAVRQMEELATDINENKKKAEKSLMMIMVQRMVKYCPMIVDPTRRFLRDFPCTEMETEVVKVVRDSVLVNDALSGLDSFLESEYEAISDKVEDNDKLLSAVGSGDRTSRQQPTMETLVENDEESSPNNSLEKKEIDIKGSVRKDGAEHGTTNEDTLYDSVEGAEPGEDKDQVVAQDSSATDDHPDRDAGETSDNNMEPNKQEESNNNGYADDDDEDIYDNLKGVHPYSDDEDATTPDESRTESEPIPLETNETLRFTEKSDVVLYVFNDLLLAATHVRVSGIFNRTLQSVKRIAAGNEVIRPVTADEDGQEVLHKYKYQRHAPLHLINVVDCPQLENGFILLYPEGPVYYEAPTPEEKALVMSTLLEAKEKFVEGQQEPKFNA